MPSKIEPRVKKTAYRCANHMSCMIDPETRYVLAKLPNSCTICKQLEEKLRQAQNPMPKIVQLILRPAIPPQDCHVMYALCEDGSVWWRNEAFDVDDRNWIRDTGLASKKDVWGEADHDALLEELRDA